MRAIALALTDPAKRRVMPYNEEGVRGCALDRALVGPVPSWTTLASMAPSEPGHQDARGRLCRRGRRLGAGADGGASATRLAGFALEATDPSVSQVSTLNLRTIFAEVPRASGAERLRRLVLLARPSQIPRTWEGAGPSGPAPQSER